MASRRFPVLIAAATAAGALMVGGLFPSSALADYVWEGTAGDPGNWSNASNWSAGTAPATGTTLATGSNIDIGIVGGAGGTTYSTPYTTVTYNVTSSTYTNTLGALEIASGYTLIATTSAGTLDLDNGYSNSTTNTITGVPGSQFGLYNAGVIDYAPTGSGQSWIIALGGAANGSASNYSTNSGIIENTGSGTLNISENGNIADLTPSPGIVNTGGTIENTGGGTLSLGTIRITGGSLINSSGTLSQGQTTETWLNGVTFSNSGTANFVSNPSGPGGGANSFYAYGTSAAPASVANTGTMTFNFIGGVNGTLSANTGSVAMIIGSGTTDGTTFINSHIVNIEANNSAVAAPSNVTAQLQLNTAGAITNNGTINIQTTANNGSEASINIGQNTTIGGTGNITFNDNAYNYIGAIGTLNTHPNFALGSGQTLSGGGVIGNSYDNYTASTTAYALGNITNNGLIVANGNNPFIVQPASGYTFTNATGATLHLSATGPGAGGALTGGSTLTSGGVTVDTNMSNSGTIQIDNTRILTENGSLTFAGGQYAVQIDSNTGTSGLIDVTGGMTLGSGLASLSVTDVGNTTLAPGVVFTLIDAGSTSGYFTGDTQGSDITVGANTFAISYTGGSGDDVTLTSIVPEPGTGGLLALLGLGLLRRRRKNRTV